MTSLPCRTVGANARRWYATLICTTLLALCLFPLAAQAQVLYGTLTGNVTDQSGAAIPKATVEALNTGTGVTQTVTTDPTGNYRFNALQAGKYKITVNASGFSPKVFDSTDVTVNIVRRVDAQLGVASQQQTVEVTGEAPILQTDKADVHTDITARQVANLPTFSSQSRNFQSLLRLVPGVNAISETNSQAANPQRAINANVNGQSAQGVNTRIDGAQDSYPWLPANVAYVPPADAIETVNVTTNSFDAEQGMAGGAAVNVQIKSGTNQFHGSADWFHTDQNFWARNYFQTDPVLFPHKNRNNDNEFGGTFGGPILKNKLFFFVDYDRTTQRLKAGPDVRTLPIAQMVQGDFRNLPGNPVIFDPATGNNHGAGKTQISCNGVLNVICPARFDPASKALIQLLQPKLNSVFATSNALNNFSGSGTALFNVDVADVKINFNPSDRTTYFGRYSFAKSLVFDPPLMGDAGGDATNGGQLGNAPGLIQSVGLGSTHTFTPNLLMDWNIGFTRQRLGATFDLAQAKGLDLLKIPGTNGAGAPGDPTLYNGLPSFQFVGTNGTTFGANLGNPNTGNPFLFRDNQFVGNANLSWTAGRHAFRYGFEYNHAQINHFQPQGGSFQTARGSFRFSGVVTAQQGTTGDWFHSWADFLLGLPDLSGKSIQLFNPTALRWNQYAWYIRDQWQVTPKLTLTLGVRWEFYPFGYSDNGKGLRYLDLNTMNVQVGGFGSVPRNDNVDVGRGRFLPRIGVAYRLTNSTVIRGGYGQSSDPNNWRYFRNSYPSTINLTNQPASTADFIPAASLTGLNGTGLGGGSYSVPTGLNLGTIPATCHDPTCVVPLLTTGVVPLPTNVGTTTIPNPFHRGYINSYNVMIQQEWKGFVGQTGYVGAYNVNPLVNMNVNASAPGTGSAGGLLSTKFGKNYTGNINAETPFKHSRYDSLQTQITRRFAKNGSMLGLAWTWSKALSYEDDEELSSLLIPYPGAWQKNYGPARFDRTHTIKLYGVLQMPFGKGQRWLQSGVGNYVLGGWQINPAINRMTGAPFTVTCGGALNSNGATQTCDQIGTYKLTGGKPLRTGQTCAQTDPTCHYFDPAAFGAPVISSAANAHFGNTNRDQFRGPGYIEVDLSLIRNFKLTERFNLELRADAIGLTNTPHFGLPNAGCPANANPAGGVEQACTTGSNNNFGVITGTLTPTNGGFFGPDPGNRKIWLAAKLTF
jgi:hypothetical protein